MKIHFLVVSSLVAAISAQNLNQAGASRSQLDAIKENHERRMVKLQEMIEERRQMVLDHEAGRRRLSDEELDRASRQVQNFERKLQSMKTRTDADHKERADEFRSLQRMNQMNYMDIGGEMRKLQGAGDLIVD